MDSEPVCGDASLQAKKREVNMDSEPVCYDAKLERLKRSVIRKKRGKDSEPTCEANLRGLETVMRG